MGLFEGHMHLDSPAKCSTRREIGRQRDDRKLLGPGVAESEMGDQLQAVDLRAMDPDHSYRWLPGGQQPTADRIAHGGAVGGAGQCGDEYRQRVLVVGGDLSH